jgi:hypothetical protein
VDDKQFRKHLADLAHGHHHPEEHDWEESPAPVRQPAKGKTGAAAGTAAAAARKRKPAAKRSRKKN